MTIISYYKRRCNKCKKIIDIADNTVTIKKGKIHYCKICAGKFIAEALNIKKVIK